MPKEYYYPDAKEPHVHVHKGGITYTGVGHNHRDLYHGDQRRGGVIDEVIQDLVSAGDERSLDIAQWIRDNT